MNFYRNSGGDSGVRAFDISSNAILVQFSDLSLYEYTSSSVGLSNLLTMKNLALSGSGLNSFINSNVKFKYSRRLR